ncbi:MAG: sulfatase-like hydrolase/transferase [Akkermansia sp.]|nr:sulfatase-like hydrolase/transferase [Akkermansia sp.]
MNQGIPSFSRKATVVLVALAAAVLALVKLRLDSGSWVLQHALSGSFHYLSCLFIVFAHVWVTCVLLLLCGIKSRVFAYGVIPLSIILWGISLYAFYMVGPCQYSEFVFAAWGTDWRESSGFLSFSSVASAVMLLAVAWGLGVFLQRRCWKFPSLSGVKLCLCTLGYIALTTALVPICVSYCPNVLTTLLFYSPAGDAREVAWQHETQTVNMLNETSPQYCYRTLTPLYRQLYPFVYTWQYFMPPKMEKAETLPSELVFADDITVVLFIGESYRSDHASWNGYARETLPRLSAHRGNIVNFPWFKSFATSTVSSIYGMLTDATCRSRTAAHTSFAGLFAHHGFDCQIILSRTTEWQENPAIYHALDGKCTQVSLHKDTDGAIAQLAAAASAPGRHLVIMEDGTGHLPYEHEPQFEQFKTEGGGEMAERIDRYDNALLQTDDMLARVAECLKDKNAVVVYSSDHGQSFGEQGCFMHAGPLNVVTQRHVFSFLWYSDAYRGRHADLLQRVSANANKALSHDDIFMSILSLGGIECRAQLPGCGNFTRESNEPDAHGITVEPLTAP